MDSIQNAMRVVVESIGEPLTNREKDPAAVALGRRGGLKGGKVRAERLSPERLSEIARKAAEKRWAPKPL